MVEKEQNQPPEAFLDETQRKTYEVMKKALITRFGSSQWYDTWLDRRSNWFERMTPREVIEKGDFRRIVDLMKLTGVLY